MAEPEPTVRVAPSRAVLSAFAAQGEPVPLDGGHATSFVVGGLVLKPLDVREETLAWQATLLSSIRCDGFRVARSRRARDGSLVVEGWCAWERLDGAHEPGRWADIVAVGERFHAALADVPRPAFLDRRTDPWAVADRVAWGEPPAEQFAHVRHLPRLLAALRPVRGSPQLVHGDLTGNVLFSEGLPPAVIDFSPYWRPTAFASAVVVADALVWEGADERVLQAVVHVADFDQFLLRALIYRAVTDDLFRAGTDARVSRPDPYLHAVELACTLAR